MDFERVLRMLAEFFDDNSLQWGVVGGLAMAVYGASRTTLDVDVVIDGESQEQVVAFLESEGYDTVHRSSGYSNHLHKDPDLGRIDVVYVRGDTSRQIFDDTGLHNGPGGLSIPVPRPAHLAAMKAFSIKNDPRRTLRELADIRALLDLPGVGRSEIRSYFARYGLEELLERLDDL